MGDNRLGSMPFSVTYTWELVQHCEASIQYDLGQCILHKEHGSRGVVIGWDSECRQPEEWCQAAGIDALTHGRAQPFYMLLVDGSDVVSYVAQESIVPTPIQGIDHP